MNEFDDFPFSSSEEIYELDYESDYSNDSNDSDDISVDIANQYYETKSRQEDILNISSLSDIEPFVKKYTSLIERSQSTSSSSLTRTSDTTDGAAMWRLRCFKQLFKLYFYTKQFEKMLSTYQSLLDTVIESITQAQAEKVINSLLSFVSGAKQSPSEVVLNSFYQSTLDCSQTLGNQRLWATTSIKLAKYHFERRQFSQMKYIVRQLRAHCTRPDGSDDHKNPVLLEVYALEIQLYTAIKDNKKLEKLYKQTQNSAKKLSLAHPHIQAIIHECGGKLKMAKKQWADASIAFSESFRNWNASGADKERLRSLKYLILSDLLRSRSLLSIMNHAEHGQSAHREDLQQLFSFPSLFLDDSDDGDDDNVQPADDDQQVASSSAESTMSVSPLNTAEVQSFKRHPEIYPMLSLVDAYQRDEIEKFEDILRSHRDTIISDEFIAFYLKDLLRSVRTKILVRLVQPYTAIRIGFIAQQLKLHKSEVDGLLVSLILDKEIDGAVDQINDVLLMNHRNKTHSQAVHYKALDTWTHKVSRVHHRLTNHIATSIRDQFGSSSSSFFYS